MKASPAHARHRRAIDPTMSNGTEGAPGAAPARSGGAVRRFLVLCFPTKGAFVLALLVCILAPGFLVVLHIHENPLLSPIDEGAHLDYVTRVEHGSIPRLGQRLQPSTLRVTACSGVALPGAGLPPCSSNRLVPQQFPGGGYSYESQQPPTYYVLTAPLQLFNEHVLGFGELEATRLVGVLWLAVGLLCLWAAGRVMGLAPGLIGAAVLLIGTAPAVIYQSAVVSNDAASVLAGSLVGLVAALAWRHPGRWTAPGLLVTGLVVASFKTTDVIAVVAVAGVFAVGAWRDRRRGQPWTGATKDFLRRWWPNGGALLLGGLVSAFGWVLISRHLALTNPKTFPAFGVLRTAPVDLTKIAQEALAMFGPVTASYAAFRSSARAVPPESLQSINLQAIMAKLLEYLLLAGGLAGLFVRRRAWYHWLGLVSVPLLYVGGVALGVSIWRSYAMDPGLSGRYGIAVAPFLAVALVAALRGIWLERGVWAFAILTFALSIYFMLAA